MVSLLLESNIKCMTKMFLSHTHSYEYGSHVTILHTSSISWRNFLDMAIFGYGKLWMPLGQTAATLQTQQPFSYAKHWLNEQILNRDKNERNKVFVCIKQLNKSVPLTYAQAHSHTHISSHLIIVKASTMTNRREKIRKMRKNCPAIYSKYELRRECILYVYVYGHFWNDTLSI